MARRSYTLALILAVLLAADCDARRFRSRGLGSGSRHRQLKMNSMVPKHGGHVGGTTTGSSRHADRSAPALVTVKAANQVRFQPGGSGKEGPDSCHGPGAAVPYDVTVDTLSRGRLFVTTPSTRRGIPATLSTVPAGGAADAPLRPYPSLRLHRTSEDAVTDCRNQLVSIVSTAKTWNDDDTLYALDSGAVEITTNPKNVCPPKIITFDLRTDTIVNITVIENAFCESQYSTIVVESCPAGRLVAYTADCLGSALTLTDLSTGASKHVTSPYLHPQPDLFYVRAGGPRFYMGDGLYGLAADNSCSGRLYLQAFSSNVQAVVDKKVLQDASDGDILDDEVAHPGRLGGVSGPLAVDPSGQRLFFPIQDELAVYCWNTSKPHHPDHFRLVAQDSTRLQYVSYLKVDPSGQLLYLQTNRFTSYVLNVTDCSEDNYYFLYINITGLRC